MQDWKKQLKKHFALPLMAIMLFMLTLTLFQLRSDKDEWTFTLHDLEGDRAALSDVVINGEYKDGFHRTQFSIVHGEVATETEIFGQPHETRKDYFSNSSVWFDDVEYRITNYSYQIDFRYTDWTHTNNSESGSARVRPSVRDIHSGNPSYSNNIEYGLTKIGEQLFFIIPTTEHYVGTNGIHALEFEPWFIHPITQSNRIVDLPLEVNRKNPRLSVLGLEAVGEQLVLILVDGNRLVIQVYEIDGTFVGAAEVPSFTLPNYGVTRLQEVNTDAEDNEVHYNPYESFSNDEQQSLTLSFRSSESTLDEAIFTYYSFDLSDGVQWVDETKGRYPDDSGNYNTLLHAQWLEDRLVVLREMAIKHERIRIPNSMKAFMIEVFKSGTRVYVGELITDVNDDWIEAMNSQPLEYGYSGWNHRRLNHLQIESVMQNGGEGHD